MKTKYVFFLRWLPAILWMLLIFYLSHQPATESAELSRGITEWLKKILSVFMPIEDVNNLHYWVRKNAHFIAYFVLALLVMWPLKKQDAQYAGLKCLGICVLYAISDEVHQLFIDGRSGQVKDVMIDALGALTGIGFFMMGTALTSRKTSKE